MKDFTASLHHRTTFGRIAAWMLVWATLATLAWTYVRTLRFGGGSMIRQPVQTTRRTYATAMDFCDDDPAGRRVLEAEAARGEGTWKESKKAVYAGGVARSTSAIGSRLSWDVELPADVYRLTLLVDSCPQPSTIRISLGNQDALLTWSAEGAQRRLAIDRDFTLDRGAHDVSLQVEVIGQTFVAIDGLVITPARSLHAAIHHNRLDCASAAGAVAMLFVGALLWGAWLLKLIVGHELDPTARLVLAQGLGLAFLGTAVTVMGIAGWFTLPVMASVFATGLVLGGRELFSIARAWLRQTALLRWPFFTVASVLLAGVLLFTASACLAPAVGVDSLIYHLPIAKWLVQEGRFTAHPYHLASAFPHLVSNLYAIGLLIFPDDGFRPATLTHACLGILWIASVYVCGKILWGRRSGLAAAFLCASFEGVTYYCTLALADLGFAATTGCAILAFVMAIRDWNDPRRGRFLILAAVHAGAAAVCKVNGPTTAIGLAIAVGLCGLVHENWKRGMRYFVQIGAISFAVASPMYVKNYLVYGNPLHPFAFGFASPGLEGVNMWSMFSRNGWGEYLGQVGNWGWIRWPYDWLRKNCVDGFAPGPAFAAGALLFLVSGRAWARRHWPLLVFCLVQIVLWIIINPLARFAWPWLGVLTLLACSPLDERPPRAYRFLVPIVLLLIGIVPLANDLIHPIGALPVVQGLSSERAYLARMEDKHAGKGLGPPLDGIRQLNQRYAEGGLTGTVLIDTNMVAYADFPTIPAYYYLIVSAAQGKNWWKAEGWPCLSMSGKTASDEDLSAEFHRLGIESILAKNGTPRPTGGPPEQFNDFIERWVREGRARREDFADSTFYSLQSARR